MPCLVEGTKKRRNEEKNTKAVPNSSRFGTTARTSLRDESDLLVRPLERRRREGRGFGCGLDLERQESGNLSEVLVCPV
jgi:hypothetical protein